LIVVIAALIGFYLSASTQDFSSSPIPGRWRQAGIATVAGLLLWWVPVALCALLFGKDHVFVDIGVFFSKLAVVSFGGAYALLAYMAQQAVETYGWMSAAEMVDGLGLAETLPGPLIKVTQFVGFLGAWRSPAPLSPLASAVIGSALTTWVTFVPPMLFIFAGAPFVEQLRANQRLSGALTGITAAVVGVVLNLTVWFALHVLFASISEARAGPLRWYAIDLWSLDFKVAVLAVVATLLAFVFHRGLIQLVAIMACLGIAVRLLS
jgi:chromate transporter